MGEHLPKRALGGAAGYDVVANQVVTVEPDWCMSHDNGAPIARTFKKIGVKNVWKPERMYLSLTPRSPGTFQRPRGEPQGSP